MNSNQIYHLMFKTISADFQELAIRRMSAEEAAMVRHHIDLCRQIADEHAQAD